MVPNMGTAFSGKDGSGTPDFATLQKQLRAAADQGAIGRHVPEVGRLPSAGAGGGEGLRQGGRSGFVQGMPQDAPGRVQGRRERAEDVPVTRKVKR